MLKDRAWIELAVVYNDGRRAILGTRRNATGSSCAASGHAAAPPRTVMNSRR
jgi:hypothetical protein